MLVRLGDQMDGWNGHSAGATVGLADGMRETLARDYIRRGHAEFVDVEAKEKKPTAKELKAYDRALKHDQTLTKGPVRRVVKPRVRQVNPDTQGVRTPISLEE